MKTEELVIVFRSGFKGMVDVCSAISDMLMTTAELEPGDKEIMIATSKQLLDIGVSEVPPIDPTVFALVCLQVGVEMLRLCPDYEISELMEKIQPCPNGSPSN